MTDKKKIVITLKKKDLNNNNNEEPKKIELVIKKKIQLKANISQANISPTSKLKPAKIF
jgi:hypothetical protein